LQFICASGKNSQNEAKNTCLFPLKDVARFSRNGSNLHFIKKTNSQAWWCTPIIPAFRRLRQNEHVFEVSLGYSKTLSQKKKWGAYT
jgi:hypothetical protein